MSPQLEDIVRKVRSDERIAPAEALVLWHEAPLWLLGELAARRKERVSGDKVYFNRNFHIEPTNLCVFNCNFCSYRRPKGSPEAWDYSMEEIEAEFAGKGYGDFKLAVAETVADALTPIRTEYTRILADKAYVDGILKDGAARAARIADRMAAKVYRKIGLLQLDR